MAHDFFVSYTRANDNAYLKLFCEDLKDTVRQKRGKPNNAADVAFIDQRDIELGAQWQPSIVEAVCHAKCFVALLSPAFFRSPYCARELALFAQRLKAPAAGNSLPALIKPVIWVDFKIDEVPVELREFQFTFGDVKATHNVKGVWFMLKSRNEYEVEYQKLLDALANDIIKSSDAWPLAPLAAPTTLAATTPFFTAVSGAPNPGGTEKRAGSGPKHVHFIYLAPSPAVLDASRAPDRYLEIGGSDWKPFFPEPTRIHKLLQKFVVADDVDFTSDELAFSTKETLAADIKTAWQRRRIVVLVVDPWSLAWETKGGAALGYREALHELDQSNAYHWCVLVPWNTHDPDLENDRANVEQVIKDTMPFHADLNRNPLFFRDDIKTVGDLQTAVGDVLTRLREEIKKRATVEMPIPPGPSKSNLQGPTGPKG